MSFDDTTQPVLDLGYEVPGPLRILLDETGIHDPAPCSHTDDDPWFDEDDEPPDDPPPPETIERMLYVLLALVVERGIRSAGCDGTLRGAAAACAVLGLAPPDAGWLHSGMACDCAFCSAVLGWTDGSARCLIGDTAPDGPPWPRPPS